jgi:hypothetical protein
VDYDTLTSRVRGQFLLSWTPHPGASLYVGYNDDLNYNGYSPFTNQFERGMRRNQQTFSSKCPTCFGGDSEIDCYGVFQCPFGERA